MIKNEKQYHISKSKLKGLERSLKVCNRDFFPDSNIYKTMRASIKSLMVDLEGEIQLWLMNKRIEFFKKLREICTQESFEEYLLSQSPEDIKTIRKEGGAVLTFMKLREVAFEDFPDLLENRLRIVWKMRTGENRKGSE